MEVYLDNAATTKPIPEAVNAAKAACETFWYNPSSLYAPSAKVFAGINEARRFFTQLTGAKSCVFTSGGTESNNTAIRSAAREGKKQHFICSAVEHSSVYETMLRLKEAGNDVDFIAPRGDFCIHADDVAAALRDDTALVAVMHVNSETGAINDIPAISRAVSRINPRALFFCDGVQAFMKVPCAAQYADMYSVSAHKIGALKGTGALFINNGHLHPLISGGGQENELRAGTENTAGIFAFRAAAEVYRASAEQYVRRMYQLRSTLSDNLAYMDGVILNSPPEDKCAPHILNASFMGVRGETLLHALEQKGILIGVGSACSSKKGVSRVIAAQGFDRERLDGVIRISLCPYNTSADIELFLSEVESAYSALKGYRRR